MKSAPLGSQNKAEFTPSLPFSQHSLGTYEISSYCVKSYDVVAQ